MNMQYELTLTPEDKERVRAWLSQKQWVDCLGNEVVFSGEPESYLIGLLENWSDVVAYIERGYNLTIEDYENDIWRRDDIDEVMQLLSEAGRKAYAELLAPIDERFVQATFEVPIPISPLAEGSLERWWWRRVPKRMGDDMLEWLSGFWGDGLS
jgi:hypothetical protein